MNALRYSTESNTSAPCARCSATGTGTVVAVGTVFKIAVLRSSSVSSASKARNSVSISSRFKLTCVVSSNIARNSALRCLICSKRFILSLLLGNKKTRLLRV